MLTEIKRTMHEKSKNFNTTKYIFKKYQIEIMELRNAITELKILVKDLKGRIDQVGNSSTNLKQVTGHN